MSHLIEPKPVKIIFSVIINDKGNTDFIKKEIENSFGPIDYESERIGFDKTSYYSEEMGAYLYRKIYSIKELIKREELVGIKIKSNDIELRTSINGKRIYNIDPGYLATEHFVLSTGKGYAHRPYLGKGVYADLTLIYKDKKFNNLEWTYPDYKTPGIQEILNNIRKIYIENLKEVNAYD